ncbi:MAG: hypothetical protein K2J20_06195, partial [Bacilli bacterium]|nr:hypothetical protein [Bacilli bacterium]
MELQYLDYKTVQKRLTDLVNNSNAKIPVKKEMPLGYTDFNLPIEHFTMGHGPKHIVVTGSYHAAEIITTTFVVRLMEDLALNPDSFNPDEYTIDFIPIVNPEGYLITTEMQNAYLSKAQTEEERIALAKDYWRIYRQDAVNTARANKVLKDETASPEEKQAAKDTLRGKKGYQALYDNVNTEEFLKDYPELRACVMDIVNKNNYPIGVCAAWTANAHGVDLSQNVPFNVNIPKYLASSEPLYSGTSYSNIRKDTPGPVNSICRDLNNFTFESENLAMLQFLALLNARKDAQIVAFLNYHSVMGKIYQRPVKEQSVIDLYNINYDAKLVENYVGARHFREEDAYDIIEGEDPYSYINEYIRLRFGINIQVELSRMGSNPIGPLSDTETFENVTIKPNIAAFKNFARNLSFIKEYSDFINNLIMRLNTERKTQGLEEFDAKEVYRIIDSVCTFNPTLYEKLRGELNNPNSYNNHVISYLFNLVESTIRNKDKVANAPIKQAVAGS